MFSFLSKTFGSLFDSVRGIQKLDDVTLDAVMKQMYHSLIDADVPLVIAEKFIATVKERCLNNKLKNITAEEYISKYIYDELVALFNTHRYSKGDILNYHLHQTRSKPLIIAVAGLQGVGKTTSIAKLLKRMVQKNNIAPSDIGVVSLDYYRPAARKQLSLLCEQNNVHCYDEEYSDPLQAATSTLQCASNDHKKVLLVDTAGRLAIDQEMMNELNAIWNIIKPDIGLLVFDIMTGQQGLTIAKEFVKTVALDGVIITKVDSDAPGGALLGIVDELHIPLLYMASGEKVGDFAPFDATRMTKLLLGMGDILTLAEQAEEKLNTNDVTIIENAIKRGDITLKEYIAIIQSLEKLGSMKSLMAAIPKQMLGGQTISDSMISDVETQNKCFVVMSKSLTDKELRFPQLLFDNDLRKKRISRGSGLSLQKINTLLEHYKRSREGMKNMRGMMKMLGAFS